MEAPKDLKFCIFCEHCHQGTNHMKVIPQRDHRYFCHNPTFLANRESWNLVTGQYTPGAAEECYIERADGGFCGPGGAGFALKKDSEE